MCISLGTDKDGELSVAEAEAVTSLRKAFNAEPIRHCRGGVAVAHETMTACIMQAVIVLFQYFL